jgi:hypothetical protein
MRQARWETRVRYGPEIRALSELAAENRDTLDLSLHQAEGTAEGITAAVREASPITKRIYDRAQGSLEDTYSDVPTEAMGGLMQQVAARERAQAQEHVSEGRTDSLQDLQDRKVRAQEGRAFAVTNALNTYRSDQEKVGRQKAALAGDAAAFTLGAFEDLKGEARQLAMDRARLRLSRQTEARQQRATEADITGIDPRTGRLTADELNRQRDDERAGRDKRGPTAGERSKHQGIVAEIQEATGQARKLRKGGDQWNEIGSVMTLPRGEDNPFGGYGQLVTRAAIELARSGKVSASTMRALKARGFMPRRAPRGWRTPGPRSPSLLQAPLENLFDGR